MVREDQQLSYMGIRKCGNVLRLHYETILYKNRILISSERSQGQEKGSSAQKPSNEKVHCEVLTFWVPNKFRLNLNSARLGDRSLQSLEKLANRLLKKIGLNCFICVVLCN